LVPPPVLKQILIGLANVLPKHKLVPQKDLAEAGFRDIRKRDMVKTNKADFEERIAFSSYDFLT